MTGFFDHCAIFGKLLFGHVRIVNHCNNECALSLCLKHQIREGFISLFCLRRQRTFNIECESFVILRVVDFVLFEHSLQYELLTLNGTVKCFLVKFSLTVKS
ncbi:hypothetical protein D3C78_1087160 [compost metagenome]